MDFSADLSVACDTAAQWILEADALVVGTGAGMGVDSGLPTCRGRHSSTRLRQVGFGYADMCNAQRLIENPSLAWTFWVHCQNLYATAVPHEGYGIIRSWAETMPSGAFSYTTNVDGHWSVAGWGSERIYERHGSVFSLQCSTPCCSHVWPELVTSGRVKRHSALPSCPTCQAPARPNVVMDSDTAFVRNERGRAQQLNYKAWKKSVDALKGPNLVMPSPQAKVVCLEIGASTVSPHVRTEMEKIAGDMHARLIRINLEEPTLPQGLADRFVCIPRSALEALREINRQVQKRSVPPPPSMCRTVPSRCSARKGRERVEIASKRLKIVGSNSCPCDPCAQSHAEVDRPVCSSAPETQNSPFGQEGEEPEGTVQVESSSDDDVADEFPHGGMARHDFADRRCSICNILEENAALPCVLDHLWQKVCVYCGTRWELENDSSICMAARWAQ